METKRLNESVQTSHNFRYHAKNFVGKIPTDFHIIWATDAFLGINVASALLLPISMRRSGKSLYNICRCCTPASTNNLFLSSFSGLSCNRRESARRSKLSKIAVGAGLYISCSRTSSRLKCVLRAPQNSTLKFKFAAAAIFTN